MQRLLQEPECKQNRHTVADGKRHNSRIPGQERERDRQEKCSGGLILSGGATLMMDGLRLAGVGRTRIREKDPRRMHKSAAIVEMIAAHECPHVVQREGGGDEPEDPFVAQNGPGGLGKSAPATVHTHAVLTNPPVPNSLERVFALLGSSISLLRANSRLRRSLANWSALGFLLTEGLSAAVATWTGTGFTWEMAFAAAAWWLAVTAVMAAGTDWLMGSGNYRLDRYGIPNGLSAIRAWSCFPFLLSAYLALTNNSGFFWWLGIGFFAGIMDYFDGAIARHVGPITYFGRAFDPVVDAMFFSSAAISATLPGIGVMPWWLAVLILIRYLGPLFMTPFIFALGYHPEIGHTGWGRTNTALTGIVFGALTLTRLAQRSVYPIAIYVALPLLVPTTLLHFRSLAKRVRREPAGE